MSRFEKVAKLKRESYDRGRMRTKSLFVTYLNDKHPETDDPIYTLKEDDHDGYVSLKRLYLLAEDLTEYEFATEYMPLGYPQWEALCSTAWFKPIIAGWRKELDLKIRARELRRMMDVAQEGGKDSLQASRFLLSKGYEDKNTKGRPSKEDIKREAQRMAEHSVNLEDEYNRLVGMTAN